MNLISFFEVFVGLFYHGCFVAHKGMRRSTRCFPQVSLPASANFVTDLALNCSLPRSINREIALFFFFLMENLITNYPSSSVLGWFMMWDFIAH